MIAVEGDPPARGDGRVYTPSSRPGCLAPHLWWADGSSLYDAFGPGFTLVAQPDADAADIRRAVADGVATGVPLTVVELTAADAIGRYPSALTLVRPDQYVAWRGGQWRGDVLDLAAGWSSGERGTAQVAPSEQAA